MRLSRDAATAQLVGGCVSASVGGVGVGMAGVAVDRTTRVEAGAKMRAAKSAGSHLAEDVGGRAMLLWFWIGTHGEYDQTTTRRSWRPRGFEMWRVYAAPALGTAAVKISCWPVRVSFQNG